MDPVTKREDAKEGLKALAVIMLISSILNVVGLLLIIYIRGMG